jgi:hypothetical protein
MERRGKYGRSLRESLHLSMGGRQGFNRVPPQKRTGTTISNTQLAITMWHNGYLDPTFTYVEIEV